MGVLGCGGEKSGLEYQFYVLGRKLLGGVPPYAAAVEYQMVEIFFFHSGGGAAQRVAALDYFTSHTHAPG